MLKGTLEGIVLARSSGRSAYGYEITAWLRDKGFADIAEGTVYALLIRIEQRGLVDVEKVPSEKGPPRKVYSLNAAGRRALGRLLEDVELPPDTPGTAPRREVSIMSNDQRRARSPRRSLEPKKQWHEGQGPHAGPPRALRGSRRRRSSATSCTSVESPTATPSLTMLGDVTDIFERAAADGTPIRDIVGEDPVEFADELRRRPTPAPVVDKERARLTGRSRPRRMQARS